jgi:hypothetical protein
MIVDEYREGHIADLDAYDEFKEVRAKTTRLHKEPTTKDFKEIRQAYADCDFDHYDYEKGGRALQFHSDALFTGKELRKAFKIVTGEAGDDGYNEFDSEAAVYQPAREYSVAIYVHLGIDQYVNLDELEATKAYEIRLDGRVVRLWWD